MRRILPALLLVSVAALAVPAAAAMPPVTAHCWISWPDVVLHCRGAENPGWADAIGGVAHRAWFVDGVDVGVNASSLDLPLGERPWELERILRSVVYRASSGTGLSSQTRAFDVVLDLRPLAVLYLLLVLAIVYALARRWMPEEAKS